MASCIGCYGVCAGVVLIAWAVVTVELQRDDRPPSRLALGIGVLVPALPAWGLFHLVHEVIGSSAVIRVSEGVGCFIVLTLGFGLWARSQSGGSNSDHRASKKVRQLPGAMHGDAGLPPISLAAIARD